MWKKFKINIPNGEPIAGEIRRMGFPVFVRYISNQNDLVASESLVLKNCLRNLSIKLGSLPPGIVQKLLDQILTLTQKAFPSTFDTFKENMDRAQAQIDVSFYNVMEVYICACFNYQPADLDDMDADELFRRYKQACLIFPEKAFTDVNQPKTEVTPAGPVEHFCSTCNRMAKNCLTPDQHRETGWIRTR